MGHMGECPEIHPTYGECDSCGWNDRHPVCGADGFQYGNPTCLDCCGGDACPTVGTEQDAVCGADRTTYVNHCQAPCARSATVTPGACQAAHVDWQPETAPDASETCSEPSTDTTTADTVVADSGPSADTSAVITPDTGPALKQGSDIGCGGAGARTDLVGMVRGAVAVGLGARRVRRGRL